MTKVANRAEFKTRYSAKDRSVYNESYTLGEVIDLKLNHLINKAETEFPFMTPVTKFGLCISDKMFRDLPKGHVARVPLLGSYGNDAKHLAGRRPTHRELFDQIQKYGYAMKWPHDSLMSLVQQRFKSIVDKYRKDKDSSIMPIPFRNYYDNEGNVVNPSWNSNESLHHSFYAGYLLINKDRLDDVQRFLMDTPENQNWLVHQFVHSRGYAINAAKKRMDYLQNDMINTMDQLESYQAVLNPLQIGDVNILDKHQNEDDALLIE